MGLKQWLAKAGMQMEDMGPAFGELGRKGAERIGMPGLGKKIGEASVHHPRAAGALGMGGIFGGSVGATIGAEKGSAALDSMTAGDPDEDLPPHIKEAIERMGYKPSQYHDSGIHPAQGAVKGAELGALAHLLRGGPGKLKGLGKYMAISGALGAGLGGLTHTYSQEEK